MILFWVICALMIVIALAFVLPPALQRSDEVEVVSDEERKQANIAVYRDQLSELDADLRNGIVAEDQYAQDRDELERRLLEDVATTRSQKKAGTAAPINARNTAYLLGIGLPLVAIIFYLRVGEPDRITNPAPVGGPPAAESTEAPPQRTQAQIEANVAKLAERLKSNPNDAQGWTMLARSYSSMEKYSDAANAYAKATELNPKDADLWAEYAFATGMIGKSLAGKPVELINRALKVDPENPKALQLAGSAAFEAKDYNKAIDYWQRVLKKVPPGSEVAQALNERVNEAKSLAASK
ncbi:MAG TPA: c-type cytochrome biogenesis protein CcmI [Pyrinomonadaceae bacterium]|nr:c-type cytochrome biogenesis protein CcmI [Pyrinomonadaceae bacterium]